MALKFSVVTPSYQQGSFIETTIQSVLNQRKIDSADIDYVICDAGSTDQTIRILGKYEDRLRWISEPDRGQADAVNKGIRMTEGDIIAWINSDDIYYPNAFSAVRKIFEENSDVDVVYGHANWIDESGRFLAKYPVRSWNYQRLKKDCYISQPSAFFRRRLVNELGDLDISLNYCMDYELWLRYGRFSNFYYADILLAGARMYSGNKSLGQRLSAHHEVNKMLFEKINYVPTSWLISFALVRSEQENGLNRSNDKDLYRLIPILILNVFVAALKYNIWALPEIFFKSIFWLAFPRQKATPDPWVKSV